MSSADLEELKLIMKMLPKDIKTVFDIGCGGKSKFYKKQFHRYLCLDLKNADIIQDLNRDQKIPLEDNTFDLVIMSQVLEHLTYPEEVISEAMRISKKYILISLPNEFELGTRLRYLFNKPGNMIGFNPYSHKHKFNLKSMEKTIKEIFGGYELRFIIGGKKISSLFKVRTFLANISPSLFGKRIFYLIKK